MHFNISCCPHNLYHVPYVVRKPIVHKRQLLYRLPYHCHFKIVKLLSLSYHKFLVYCVIFFLSFMWLTENGNGILPSLAQKHVLFSNYFVFAKL